MAITWGLSDSGFHPVYRTAQTGKVALSFEPILTSATAEYWVINPGEPFPGFTDYDETTYPPLAFGDLASEFYLKKYLWNSAIPKTISEGMETIALTDIDIVQECAPYLWKATLTYGNKVAINPLDIWTWDFAVNTESVNVTNTASIPTHLGGGQWGANTPFQDESVDPPPPNVNGVINIAGNEAQGVDIYTAVGQLKMTCTIYRKHLFRRDGNLMRLHLLQNVFAQIAGNCNNDTFDVTFKRGELKNVGGGEISEQENIYSITLSFDYRINNDEFGFFGDNRIRINLLGKEYLLRKRGHDNVWFLTVDYPQIIGKETVTIKRPLALYLTRTYGYFDLDYVVNLVYAIATNSDSLPTPGGIAMDPAGYTYAILTPLSPQAP